MKLFYKKLNIENFFLWILISICLSACGPIGPQCIDIQEYEFNSVDYTFYLYADGLVKGDNSGYSPEDYLIKKSDFSSVTATNLGKWLNTGIKLQDVDLFKVDIDGNISMSNPIVYYDVDATSSSPKAIYTKDAFGNPNTTKTINLLASEFAPGSLTGSNYFSGSQVSLIIYDPSSNPISNNVSYDNKWDKKQCNDKGTMNTEYTSDCNATYGGGLKVMVGGVEQVNALRKFNYLPFPVAGNYYYFAPDTYPQKQDCNGGVNADNINNCMDLGLGNISKDLHNKFKVMLGTRIWTFSPSIDGELSFSIVGPKDKPASSAAGNYQVLAMVNNPGTLAVNASADNSSNSYDSITYPNNAGKVEIVFVDDGKNPNITDTNSSSYIDVSKTAYILKKRKPTNMEQPPNSGVMWLRVKSDNYFENSGYYTLAVKVMPQVNTAFSKFVSNIVSDVRKLLNDATMQIYARFVGGSYYEDQSGNAVDGDTFTGTKIKKQVTNPIFITSIRWMLTLYIMFYAVYFILGFVEVKQWDLAIRCFKIALVIVLIGPNSWQFFNTYLFGFFTKTTDFVISAVTNGNMDRLDTSNAFSFVDKMLSVLFNGKVWLKILGYIFSVPGALIIPLFIFCFFIPYLCVIAETIIGYLLAMVGVYFLLSLAPIFISFILFEHTKNMTKKWISYLINFTLQPIMLITLLAVINEIIMHILKMFLSIPVCWQCAVKPYIDLGVIISMIDPGLFSVDGVDASGFAKGILMIPLPFCINWYVVNYEYTTTSMVYIIILWMLTKMFEEALDLAPNLASTLSSVTSGSANTTGNKSPGTSIMQDLLAPANYAKDGVKKVLGLDDETQKELKTRDAIDKNKEKMKNKSLEELEKEEKSQEKGIGKIDKMLGYEDKNDN